MSRDLAANVDVRRVISPISPSATGTITGQVVDRQGYGSLVFVIEHGLYTTTAGAFTPVVKHGSATGSLASAADSVLVGTEAGATVGPGTADANSVTKIGYIGSERYVSLDLAVVGTATGVHSVVAVLGEPRKGPVAQ